MCREHALQSGHVVYQPDGNGQEYTGPIRRAGLLPPPSAPQWHRLHQQGSNPVPIESKEV